MKWTDRVSYYSKDEDLAGLREFEIGIMYLIALPADCINAIDTDCKGRKAEKCTVLRYV